MNFVINFLYSIEKSCWNFIWIIYIVWGRTEMLQYPLPFHYHGLSPHLFSSFKKPLVEFFFSSFVQLVSLSGCFL